MLCIKFHVNLVKKKYNKLSSNVVSHKNKNIKKNIYIYIYKEIIYKIKLPKIVLNK